MRVFLVLTISLLFGQLNLSAQHQDVGEKPDLWRGTKKVVEDSSALINYFQKGQFKGHIRAYSSVTQNKGSLTDYFANAVGGGMRYQTASFYHFDAALSGFFIFNVGSSDLAKPDKETGALNRYENQLFDMLNRADKSGIERMEELFIRYSRKKGFISLGRQLINTPFINLQDGRMRPTGIEGLVSEFKIHEKLRIDAAWIWDFSPRGTTDWFSVEKSIGLTSMGLNEDGTKGNYLNNLQSDGVANVGLIYSPTKTQKFQFWDTYIDNMLNTMLFQWDGTSSLNADLKLKPGIQFIYQNAIRDGGNEDQTKTYVSRDHESFTFGGTIGIQTTKWNYSINYNRITDSGRYVFPREWGREPFYTFIPRERSEGFGDVHAFVLKAGYTNQEKTFKSLLSVGYVSLPDVKTVALNKYGLPSYFQANIDLRKSFSGFLEGFETQLLLSTKIGMGETYENNRYVINKVDMIHANLIVNYYF